MGIHSAWLWSKGSDAGLSRSIYFLHHMCEQVGLSSHAFVEQGCCTSLSLFHQHSKKQTSYICCWTTRRLRIQQQRFCRSRNFVLTISQAARPPGMCFSATLVVAAEPGVSTIQPQGCPRIPGRHDALGRRPCAPGAWGVSCAVQAKQSAVAATLLVSEPCSPAGDVERAS